MANEPLIPDTEPVAMTGRDLAARILEHPEGGVAGLLRLTEGQETEWLEFKAALHPKDGQFNPGEKEDDYRWHVAKAVIALANWVGGAVLLGVDDNAQAVELAASDPRRVLEKKGREAFNREVVQEALVRGAWKTGREGNLRLGADFPLDRLIDIRNTTHQGQPVIVILVSPVPADELLEISEERNNRERRLILVRDRGAVGQVRELQGRKEVRVLEDARAQALKEPTYSHLWQQFLTESRSVLTPSRDDLEPRIAAYCRDVREQLGKWHDLFTPLDAEENLEAGRTDLFEPEAVESLDYFESDDPWDDQIAEGLDEDNSDEEMDYSQKSGDEAKPVRLPRRAGVFELLKQEPRAVLLGEPGGGKTTCLQRLTLEAAGAYQPGGVLTLFIPLSRYTDAGLRSLVARALKTDWEGVAWLIQQRRLVLLLDAFNECPRHHQEQCGQEVMALLRDYPELPLVISSRVTVYRFDLHLPTFVVRPLDRGQQQQFLSVYLKSAEKAAEILEKLYRQPGGELVASSPILLRMVVEVSHRQGELTAGRAQLYHRFFTDWYDREQKKERRTGVPLRWPFDLTLEALGHLAFHSRKEGMVICDLGWAIRNLQTILLDESRRFLERMAQGLLLTLDPDTQTLTFSHETIQEFFAAEYLLRNLEQLFSLSADQWETWRMPLAYVFELVESVPDNLVKIVWLMEPLLVAAALRDDEQFKQLPILEKWDPWLKGILKIMRGQPVEETRYIMDNSLYPPSYSINELTRQLESPIFWYAALIHPSGKERIHILLKMVLEEEPWLYILPPIFKNYPELNSRIVSQENVKQAYILSRYGLVKFEKISDKKQQDWIVEADIEQAIWLVRSNLISSKNISIERKRAWIERASAKQAIRLVQMKLIPLEEISPKRMQAWIAGTTAEQAIRLVQYGLIHSEVIPIEQKRAWIERANAKQAIRLVQMKLIPLEEISPERMQAWIAGTTAEQAFRLVRYGLIRSEDIPIEQKRAWITEATAKQTLQLVQKKLIRLEEIPPERKQTWIAGATTEQIPWLVQYGLIRSEDIPIEQKRAWITEATAKQTLRLVQMKLIPLEEIPPERKQAWMVEATAKQTIRLVQMKLISLEEIPPERKQAWMAGATANQALRLVRNRLIRSEDIPIEQIRAWIAQATAKQILRLVQQKLIRLDQIWMARVTTNQALRLVQNGLTSSEDIPIEQIRAWIAKATAEQVFQLVQQKLIRLDQIWMAGVTAEQALRLVQNRLIRSEDIPIEQKRAWIMGATAEQVLWLVQNGLIRLDQIPNKLKKV